MPTSALSLVQTKGKTIAIVLVIAFLGGAYVHQVQTNNILKQQGGKVNGVSTSTISQAAELRNEVGKLIELPSNETPTIATVTNVSNLQNQAFFANAQNGDKVLMFAQAKEVILYRPSTNKIVQVAPLNPGNSGATQ